MSFDLIPMNLLTEIFHRLPFEDRVRLGGVNRSFRNASDESINKMKSLDVTDYLIKYSVAIQSFPSLLESSSSTLESIDVTKLSDNETAKQLKRQQLKIMADFDFPKLKYLDISAINNAQTKRLISQCRNVRSIVQRHEPIPPISRHDLFEWPQDIVFEKLEKLVVHFMNNAYNAPNLNLSPLIGNVPNLKHLSIKNANLAFCFQEYLQLLASVPRLQLLNLELGFNDLCGIVDRDFSATWRLPELTDLAIHFINNDYWVPAVPTIQVSFPKLKSLTSRLFTKIDDQSITALSQLEQLQELRTPNMELTKDQFIEMIVSLRSLTVLEISQIRGNIGDQDFLPLSQVKNLRELDLGYTSMIKNVIWLTSIQSMAILKIGRVSAIEDSETFLEFLTSSGAVCQQNLEIRLLSYTICQGSGVNFDQLKVILEEMKSNGILVETKRHLDIIIYIY